MENIWVIPVFICLIIGLLSITLFLRESIIREEERKLREYREKIIERKLNDKMWQTKRRIDRWKL